MKKNMFLVAMFAIMSFFSSCQKDDSVDAPVASSQQAVVTLNLSGGNQTKADAVDETKVNSIQVFVFNGDALDGYKSASIEEVSALTLDVNATVGKRDIYAFVNAPDLSAYSSKANLLAAQSLFSDNALDGFVMSGKLENRNVGTTYKDTVKVDRYAARVKIEKITRNFSAKALKDVKFQVSKMYLTSVVSNEKYSFAAPDSCCWLNASFGATRSLSTDNAFIYYKPTTAIVINNEASHAQNYCFYGYANANAEDDTADPMTFRCTRLVIECQIDVNGDDSFGDDEYFTYPISLGALESNKSYEIRELVLTRLGNHSNGDDEADDGEDIDIETGAVTVSIVVNDWTSVLIGDASGVVTI